MLCHRGKRRGVDVVDLFAPPPPGPEAVEALVEAIPELVVLLSCGDDTSEAFAERKLPDVQYIEPALTRAQEEQALKTYDDAFDGWAARRRQDELRSARRHRGGRPGT